MNNMNFFREDQILWIQNNWIKFSILLSAVIGGSMYVGSVVIGFIIRLFGISDCGSVIMGKCNVYGLIVEISLVVILAMLILKLELSRFLAFFGHDSSSDGSTSPILTESSDEYKKVDSKIYEEKMEEYIKGNLPKSSTKSFIFNV